MNNMTKFYMAPMEGVTTYVFRNVFEKHYGGIDKYYTPFVANSKLKGREKSEVSRETNTCENLIPQILVNNENTFLCIAGQLEDMGYREVNLNIGCPSRTVTAKGRGAGLLDDLFALEKFLDNIFDKCNVDISIKTRIGISSLNEWEDILRVYKNFPIKELIIHTRLLDEMYTGNGHIESFKMAKEMLDVPLCYNGEIKDEDSFNMLKNECMDVEAVMLGRGLVSDLMLAWKLKNLENKSAKDETTFENTNVEKVDDKFVKFHNDLLDEYVKVMPGETPVLFKMKELWGFWGKYFCIDSKGLKEIRKAKRVDQYKNIINEIIVCK